MGRYPRALWLLALANFVLFGARGMTAPFLVIFFGQIVGLPDGLVGAGIAVNAVAGVIFTLLVAGVIDRLGPRRVLIAMIFGCAVAIAVFPLATTPVRFFAAMVFYGCVNQLYWPASDTFATSLVPVSQAGEMFALLRVANAIGIGAGGLVGGLMVVGGRFDQYRTLYLVSGVGIALAGVMVILFVHGLRRGAPASSALGVGTWRDVLADRRFVVSQVVMFILIAGYTQVQVSAPPYLRAQAGVDEAVIGLLFLINTVIVIAAQLPVATRISSWGRGTTFAIAALFWMVALAMIGASPWLGVLPFAAFVVYTLGEMLFMPTSGVLVVELAPERLRGRYLAASSVTWGIAWGLSSWLGGVVLGTPHPGLLWPLLIVIVLIGAAGAFAFDRVGAPARPGSPRAAALDLD
ncbi:MAG TPA: MFS transporter [Thermomicrobiaceae bacterium]|nr:MFS transporter [Thermomicrobiaceae bacterium]